MFIEWDRCILNSPQDALAALGRKQLVRDDSGPSRVYRDKAGTIYHSVTSILSATSDMSGLEHWAKGLERIYGAGAADQDRRVAAFRGTQAHNQAEYLLKTANQLGRRAANRAGTYRRHPDGLYRIPGPLYKWALERVAPKVPPVSLSAKGYARSLTDWVLEHVTQCFACEFSVHHPAGFAGTSDGLVSVGRSTLELHNADPALAGAPFIADWKTSAKRKSPQGLENYRLQAGAYSLGLQHLTGIRPAGAFIVVARRVGGADVTFMSQDELVAAEDGYLARCRMFYEALEQQAA